MILNVHVQGHPKHFCHWKSKIHNYLANFEWFNLDKISISEERTVYVYITVPVLVEGIQVHSHGS